MDDSPNVQALALFTSLVALWGLVRPGAVRDNDNRLLPHNLTARIFVVAVYTFVYLLVVAAFHFGGEAVMKISDTTPYANVFKSFDKQSPFLGIFLLGTIMSLAPSRELERAFLVWTHSARHLHRDAETLAEHLLTCLFKPTEEERRRSIDRLKYFNLYLTDPNITEPINFASLDAWRKVNALLRLTSEWNAEENRILDKASMKLLQEIATAHERKTRLAVDIIRILAHVRHGQSAGHTLSEVSDLLTAAPHGDPGEITAVETRLKALISSTSGQADGRPLRLSSEELGRYVAEIQDYFSVEYQLLLDQIALLAAKSVILAGDQAPERLQEMKSVGIGGLGRIEPINFDRILKVFMLVGIGGFLIFYLLRYPSFRRSLELDTILDQALRDRAAQAAMTAFATTALIMAFAALFGAIFGSQRTLVRKEHAPWATYIAAGLMGVLFFFMIQSARLVYFGGGRSAIVQIRELIAERKAKEEAAASTAAPHGAPVTRIDRSPQATLFRLAPNAVLPFVVTLTICWLARIRAWPSFGRIATGSGKSALWERFWDGATVAAVLFVGMLLALSLRELLGISLPRSLQEGGRWNPQYYLPTVALGFFIGASVVRDVRFAAQAQLVTNDQEPAKPRSSTVATNAEVAHG